MTILYTQILKLPGTQILACAFSRHGGEAERDRKVLVELRNVIQGIPDKSANKLYDYECVDGKYVFYIKILNRLAYAVISDKATSHETASKYIDSVGDLFLKVYSENEPRAYSGFEATLKSASNEFNSKSSYMEADAELKKTRDVCVKSLNKILKRGEMIDKLADLADKLKAASHQLNRSSRNMYFESIMSQYSMYAAVVVFIFIFLYFILKR
jgi:hypothetical protein